jgi:cytochrome c oxidase subunit 2
LPASDSFIGSFYNLEVDNSLVLPYNNVIKLLVTSNDVIHRFAIPRLRLKVDCNPGRLNAISFNLSYPGVLFGNCSEICGANHSFMPISLQRVSTKAFLQTKPHPEPYP